MVGILTFHAAHNYGSALQAYALQQTIKKLGYPNEIINFKPKAQNEMYALIDTGRLKPGTLLKNIGNIRHVNLFVRRKKKFDDFIKYDLIKSDEKFLDEKQTRRRASDYKAIICGSDQIWNMNAATRDKSWVYYLDFPYEGKSIAYAPSMGNHIDLPQKEKQLRLIRRFHYVSVREEAMYKYLRQEGIDCEQVLDPTLLLQEEDWTRIEGPCPISGEYILFYSINCDRKVARQAVRLGKKLGLPVYCPVLHPRLWGTGILPVVAGPKEFLALVHNATFVCTNSFHGTVFSIVYKKAFASIFDNDSKDERRRSLLLAAGMSDHAITSDQEISIEKFKSKVCLQTMADLQKGSIGFLQKALGESYDRF